MNQHTLDTPKQISIGVTFLVVVILLLWLLFTKLDWTPIQQLVDDGPHITMAEFDEEEFIDVEVEVPPITGQTESAPAYTPEDVKNESQPAPQTGVNLSTQGKVDHPAQTVTTPKPSPVKEQQKPTPEKPAAAVKNEKEEAQKALAQQTNNKLANAFANAQNKNNAKSGTADNGPSGSATGNPNSAASGDAKGTSVGIEDQSVGGGWRFPNYSRNIQSNEVGFVRFEIQVRQDGSVGNVTQIGGKGLSKTTINKCIAEIKSKKFTNSNMATAEPATARLTFRFVDPKK